MLSATIQYFSERNTALLIDILHPTLGFAVYLTYRYLGNDSESYLNLAKGVIVAFIFHLTFSLSSFGADELRLEGLMGKTTSSFILAILLPFVISTILIMDAKAPERSNKLSTSFFISFCFLSTALTILLLGSRAGMIIFFLSVILLVATQKLLLKVTIIFCLLPAVLISGSTYSRNVSYTLEKYFTTFVAAINFSIPKDKSSNDRVAVFNAFSNEQISVFGSGLQQFRKKLEPLASENTYLQTLVELGWFGLVLLLVNLFSALYVVLKNLNSAIARDDLKGFYFWLPILNTVIALFIYGIFNDFLYQNYIWLLLGIIYGYSSSSKQDLRIKQQNA